MASFFASLASLPTRLQRVTSSGSYVPQIDGLRFIAILVVIIYHSSSRALKYYQPTGSIESFFVKYQPNGMAGVELFFFISGLIISYPFLSGNKPSLAKFYKRRLLRLEPPYILVLTICFLGLGVLGFQPDAATQFELQEMPLWQSYVSSIFYMHGTLYGTAPRLNPPLWSLEIEVVFYLLAPFLLAGYLKIQNFRNRVIFAIGAVLAGLLVQAIVVSINYPWYYRFPTHLYAFFLGIVVSDWTTRKDSFYSDRSQIFDLLWMFGFVALFVSASLQNIATDAVTYAWVLMLRACAFFVCLSELHGGRSRGASWEHLGSP
jgi:peptidoglycan/LPS O-acetylase OafA/YrhL